MLLYGPNWAKFGPSLGQIGPKQPIFKVETRDFGSLYVFENTHHYQCIHNIIWAYTRWNLGQVDQNWVNCWAKFEPNWAQKSPIGPNWTGVPILIIETCIILIIMTTLRAYLKWLNPILPHLLLYKPWRIITTCRCLHLCSVELHPALRQDLWINADILIHNKPAYYSNRPCGQ